MSQLVGRWKATLKSAALGSVPPSSKTQPCRSLRRWLRFGRPRPSSSARRAPPTYRPGPARRPAGHPPLPNRLERPPWHPYQAAAEVSDDPGRFRNRPPAPGPTSAKIKNPTLQSRHRRILIRYSPQRLTSWRKARGEPFHASAMVCHFQPRYGQLSPTSRSAAKPDRAIILELGAG